MPFEVKNLLSNIFRNYPSDKNVTVSEISKRVLPDLKNIVEQQERDVANGAAALSAAESRLSTEILQTDNNAVAYAVSLGGIL